MTWLIGHWGMIVSVAFGLSEALSFIPAVESNGVFQMAHNLLKQLKKPDQPK